MFNNIKNWLFGLPNDNVGNHLDSPEDSAKNLLLPFRDKFRDFIVSTDILGEIDKNRDSPDFIQEIKKNTRTARINLCKDYHGHVTSAIEERGLDPDRFIPARELAKALYDDELKMLNSTPLPDNTNYPKFNSMSQTIK